MSARDVMSLARTGRLALSGTVPVGVQEDTANSPQNVQPVELPLRLYPPINWENLDQLNYVGLPAIGAQSIILDFTVPDGRNGIIKKVACNFVGGGWVEGSGNITWQILVDGGTPPGATSYNNILGSLGSPANPVEIPGFRIFEHQRIQFVANNVNIALAGQLVGARLIGWLYPRELDGSEIWI